MKIMITSLVVIFGGIIGFNLFKGYMIKQYFAHYEVPAVTVSSVTAESQNWKPNLHAIGNFVAINGVDVNAQTSGNVVAIHFKSGEFIEKDAPLIDIDDSIEQATLQFNQSNLTLQTLNFKRQEDLFKRGATPSSNVDEARAKLMQAKANVKKTEAAIAQKHIRAPFAGHLGLRQVNLGQYISPGQTNIVTLQSMDPLHLNFYLPEQLISKVHIHQKITFTVEQNPDYIFEGEINAINAKADTNTHNIELQATLPNCPTEAFAKSTNSNLVQLIKQPHTNRKLVQCSTKSNTTNKVYDFNFLPGMFAEIAVDQPALNNAVVVPSTAISYSLYGNSVFIIKKDKPTKKDQEILTVQRVFVKTGDQKNNYTVITSGITAGQQVVSSGELKLQNGTRVIINNKVPLSDTVDLSKLGQ